jgi:hypothetical protein
VGLLFFFLEFATLVGAAFYYRHRPSVHKRLMLLAVLGGLTPTPVARIIGHWLSSQPWAVLIFPVSFVAFTSLSAIYDRVSEGRIHPVSLCVPISVVGLAGLRGARDSTLCNVAGVRGMADCSSLRLNRVAH